MQCRACHQTRAIRAATARRTCHIRDLIGPPVVERLVEGLRAAKEGAEAGDVLRLRDGGGMLTHTRSSGHAHTPISTPSRRAHPCNIRASARVPTHTPFATISLQSRYNLAPGSPCTTPPKEGGRARRLARPPPVAQPLKRPAACKRGHAESPLRQVCDTGH